MDLTVLRLHLILLTVSISVDSSKVLIFPLPMFKTSVLTNMEKISAILAEHGRHEIHFLMDDWYTLPKFLKKSGVMSITFPRPIGDHYPPPAFTANLRKGMDLAASYYPGRISDDFFYTYLNSLLDCCDSLLGSEKVLDQLKKERFDLLLIGSGNPCSKVLASYLHGIPTIEFFTVGGLLRLENRDFPLSLSYFPMLLTSHAPDMSFIERVNNVVTAFLLVGMFRFAEWRSECIAAKHGIEIKEIRSLRLVFGGFPVEYPVPNTPDVVYMNGILISKPEPLEQELENFMQSSGDHGVVIVSFGSMIREYGEHYRELFAEALSKIPQKAIWKYQELVPRKLGNNTKLMKWLPQVDLLAHPKTKGFITHCGINSAYESIYYGVPILGLALFYDQPPNCALFARHHEAGIQLDVKTINVEQLVSSLHEIISTPKYRENAKQLGSFLRDQPMSGKDLLLYWVDYVARHKGVEHLKPHDRHRPWYQFYLIDVISFLLLILSVIILVGICGCIILYKKCVCGFVSKIKKE